MTTYNVFGARGGKFSTGKPKSDVEWSIHRAKEIPGPGQYGNPLDKLDQAQGGGKFSTAHSKSDVEWMMYRASQLPGPGQYQVGRDLNKEIKGGRFNLSEAKSDIDWKMYHAARMPGPGEYYKARDDFGQGGKFSVSKPKSDVEWSIYRASQIPGPGEYEIDKGRTLPGGRWSKSNPKSETEWQMLRASKLPGPSDYAGDTLKPPALPGGRFSTANPKSDVEWSMYRAKQTPGPGHYLTDTHTIGGRTKAQGFEAGVSREGSRDSSPARVVMARPTSSAAHHSRSPSVNKSPAPLRPQSAEPTVSADALRRAAARSFVPPTPPRKKGKTIGCQTESLAEDFPPVGVATSPAVVGVKQDGDRRGGGATSNNDNQHRSPRRGAHSPVLKPLSPDAQRTHGDHIYASPPERPPVGSAKRSTGKARRGGSTKGVRPGQRTTPGKSSSSQDSYGAFSMPFDTAALDDLLDRSRPTSRGVTSSSRPITGSKSQGGSKQASRASTAQANGQHGGNAPGAK